MKSWIVETNPSWLKGLEPGLTVTELTTPVVWAVAVAWACRLAADAPFVKTEASNCSENCLTAVTAPLTFSAPDSVRPVTFGISAWLIAEAVILTVALPEFMSA